MISHPAYAITTLHPDDIILYEIQITRIFEDLLKTLISHFIKVFIWARSMWRIIQVLNFSFQNDSFFLKRYIIQYLHFCSSFSCKRVECWYSIGLNEELLIDVYVSSRFYWTVQKWGSSDVYSQHQILHILPTPNLIIIIFYV